MVKFEALSFRTELVSFMNIVNLKWTNNKLINDNSTDNCVVQTVIFASSEHLIWETGTRNRDE